MVKLHRLYLEWFLESKIFRKSKKVIKYEGKKILISTPNFLCFYRAKTFPSKEPETLKWIKSMPADSNYWDVGANIGLYSLAAAILRKARVISFEPSPFNYPVLVENIHLNLLYNYIVAVPIPLNNLNQKSFLFMSENWAGGALSTFGGDYGFDGKPLYSKLQFQTLGFRGDSLADFLHLDPPDYIKLDVDGIEHLILTGCSKLLRNVRSVLVEVSPKFVHQTQEIFSEMRKAGLVPENRRFLNPDSVFKESLLTTVNLVWNRV